MINQNSASTQQKTSGLAIAALILAIFIPIVGLVLGIIALSQIKNNPNLKGKGLAIAAIIIGSLTVVLAVIIFVGVSWFLIGDPANLVANRFQLSAPLVANAMSMDTTGIDIEIRNGAGNSLNITEISVENCNPSTTFNQIVNANNLETFSIPCDSALSSGDRFNGDIIITYKTESGTPKQSTGTISGRVP